MNKFDIVKKLKMHGDCVITLRGKDDGKLVTTNFNEKYIKNKKSKRYTILKDSILLFSWTDDRFENIKVKDIKSIIPLSKILNNTSPEIKVDG